MHKQLSLLQQQPIFGGIREDIVQFILDHSTTKSVSIYNSYFKEGDQAHSMYIIELGSVVILKEWKGHQFVLRHLQTGDCFGEMALMDMKVRSASAVAEVDSNAVEISADTLYALYKKDLEQFTMIQMNMGREVCRRLREMHSTLVEYQIELDAHNGKRSFVE